jgi:hypothetical protein
LPILNSTSGTKCLTELHFFIDALKSNCFVTKGEVVGSCKQGNGAAVCQKMWATSWLAQQLYTFHERALLCEVSYDNSLWVVLQEFVRNHLSKNTLMCISHAAVLHTYNLTPMCCTILLIC